MNLEKLFKAQKEIRSKIFGRFPELKGQDNLSWLMLSLQVELGELANEWRGFKMWSNDKVPRDYCKMCRFTETPHECKNPLLEEFADCLSFVLEIGLEIGVDTSSQEITCNYTRETAIDSFNEMFRLTSEWEDVLFAVPEAINEQYHEFINLLIGIGEIHLRLTAEQIEQAYFDKNKINHARQENGY